MALVDEIKVSAKAGNGGNGVVRWLHEYAREFGGPSGGDGGNGGDIIFRAVRDLNALARYRGVSKFKAEPGGEGQRKNMAGKNGKDFIIEVPVGAYITNTTTGKAFELLNDGEEKLALKGGRGGLGNSNFKSSTNQYPTECTPGGQGESAVFIIELKIIADAGLIGLPNAGKSSLLNALTKAKAKIGSYAFTTIEPNLGVFFNYVIADIPGLIEGAHEGKGLGDTFLRHIARTRLLIHCVASDSAQALEDYESVRKELNQYSEELSRKPEIVILTKADMLSSEDLGSLEKQFKKKKIETISVTILDDASVKAAGDSLSRFLSKE